MPYGEIMLNIMLSGCCGSMGRAVTAFADNRDDIKITAGIDREGRECRFPTFVSPFSFNGKVDVIIDFSHPSLLDELLDYCKNSDSHCDNGFERGAHSAYL